jgi:hypothetical protein
MKYLKKLVFWGCIAAVVYGILSYHLIFFGSTPKLLKKAAPNANYIIFSTQGKSPESILSIDELRNNGVGELMVQMGMLSEKDLERLLLKIEEKRKGGS